MALFNIGKKKKESKKTACGCGMQQEVTESSCCPSTGEESESSCCPSTGEESESSCCPSTGEESESSCCPSAGEESESSCCQSPGEASESNCCPSERKVLECIKVLGSGCKSCHELYENCKKAVEKSGLSVEVEYVTDLEKIMKYGAMSMPGLVVNEKVVSMGKVLKVKEVEELLQKCGY